MEVLISTMIITWLQVNVPKYKMTHRKGSKKTKQNKQKEMKKIKPDSTTSFHENSNKLKFKKYL